jgi:hypothetical protein
MKTSKHISLVVMVGLLFSIFMTSCENNPKVTTQEDLLPKSFSVQVPSSISNSAAASQGGRKGGRIKADSLGGNEVYLNLNTFIAVGAGASLIVDGVIDGIRKYHIDRLLSLSYVSDDDNRTKNLIVTSEVSFEGKTWDYQLTITDGDAEGQADGGKALQIFWNKQAPIAGIAIIKPYNCNRKKDGNAPDAVFRIDYSEAGDLGYDKQMEVQISGLPLANPLQDPYSVNTLHMFVGKKGDVVDVFGNTNHPNAILFSGTPGFNWAFVASSNDAKNIGVAEVGLPPSKLDSKDRKVLLKDYSIKNVFTREITLIWPAIDQTLLATYLKNTSAPGYFNSAKGFISAGVSPGADWDVLNARLDALTPYDPFETSNLVLNFK